MTRPADIYLRFLKLAEAVRGQSSTLVPLDPLEERILEVVAKTNMVKARLCVRDLIGFSELGSPATLHNRLKSMREKGWITLADTEDTRRKQVELTQEALNHFDKLSECLLAAAQPQA